MCWRPERIFVAVLGCLLVVSFALIAAGAGFEIPTLRMAGIITGVVAVTLSFLPLVGAIIYMQYEKFAKRRKQKNK